MNRILLLLGTGLVVLNMIVCFRDIPRLIDLTKTENQLFYQEKNLCEGEYHDAVLPILVKDKEVYVRDDKNNVMFSEEDYSRSAWEFYLDKIYHGINSANLLTCWDAQLFLDDSLNEAVIPDEQLLQFTDMGYINDMLRNSFAVNSIEEEWGNYFHYYWFYTANGEKMHLYVNPEGLESSKYVLLWDDLEGRRCENLYMMSYDFYKREIAE